MDNAHDLPPLHPSPHITFSPSSAQFFSSLTNSAVTHLLAHTLSEIHPSQGPPSSSYISPPLPLIPPDLSAGPVQELDSEVHLANTNQPTLQQCYCPLLFPILQATPNPIPPHFL